MKILEQAAQRIFGERSEFYTTSPVHKDPQVLARVIELAAPQANWLALDVATGAGHTAFALAPHVNDVVCVVLVVRTHTPKNRHLDLQKPPKHRRKPLKLPPHV